jgi:hypothetical protein
MLAVVVFPSDADFRETLHDNRLSSSPCLLFHRTLWSSGGILALNLESAGLKPPPTDGYSGLVALEKSELQQGSFLARAEIDPPFCATQFSKWRVVTAKRSTCAGSFGQQGR